MLLCTVVSPTYTSVSPSSIPARAAVEVVVTGAALQDVSGDSAAFVVSSAACSSVVAVSGVTTSSAAPANGNTTIAVTVNASGVVGGTYRLCVRWCVSRLMIAILCV